MTKREASHPGQTPDLPERMRPLFWDHDFSALTWDADRDLLIARVLVAGDWEATRWLRRELGDGALRAWILERRGRGLSPRQLRFWELILRLPHRQVNSWLAEPGRQIWESRAAR
jgi:hypothetical protein